MVVRPEQRTREEQRALEQLEALHPEIQTALTLFASFAALIRKQSDAPPTLQVEQWMAQAMACGVRELKAFATKLRQDAESVLAAFTLPYRQGQTEGQVNRLKLLKRSMYDPVGELQSKPYGQESTDCGHDVKRWRDER